MEIILEANIGFLLRKVSIGLSRVENPREELDYASRTSCFKIICFWNREITQWINQSLERFRKQGKSYENKNYLKCVWLSDFSSKGRFISDHIYPLQNGWLQLWENSR